MHELLAEAGTRQTMLGLRVIARAHQGGCLCVPWLVYCSPLICREEGLVSLEHMTVADFGEDVCCTRERIATPSWL